MKGRISDRSASMALLLALATGCSATVTVDIPGAGGMGASAGGTGGAGAGTAGAGGMAGTAVQTTGRRRRGLGPAVPEPRARAVGVAGAAGATGDGRHGRDRRAPARAGRGGAAGSVGRQRWRRCSARAVVAAAAARRGRRAAAVAGGTTGGGGAGLGGGGGALAGSGGNGGGAGSSASGRGGSAGTAGAAGTGEITLDPTPGNYKQICDGSLGVMIDATHFLDGNDEEQGMRVYTRGANANPVKTIDISSMLGLSTDDEADFEDAARIGNRVYVIESHGRNKDGQLDRARYRFFGMDVAGTSPSITLTVPGYTTKLLDQMLVAADWATPNTTVIATLTAKSNLGTSTDASLAPLAGGTTSRARLGADRVAAEPAADRLSQPRAGHERDRRVAAERDGRADGRHGAVRRGGAARSRRSRDPRDGLVAAAQRRLADRRSAGRQHGSVSSVQVVRRAGGCARRRAGHHGRPVQLGARSDRHLREHARRPDPVRPGRSRRERRRLQGRVELREVSSATRSSTCRRVVSPPGAAGPGRSGRERDAHADQDPLVQRRLLQVLVDLVRRCCRRWSSSSTVGETVRSTRSRTAPSRPCARPSSRRPSWRFANSKPDQP